jgi:hypothetical protein
VRPAPDFRTCSAVCESPWHDACSCDLVLACSFALLQHSCWLLLSRWLRWVWRSNRCVCEGRSAGSTIKWMNSWNCMLSCGLIFRNYRLHRSMLQKSRAMVHQYPVDEDQRRTFQSRRLNRQDPEAVFLSFAGTFLSVRMERDDDARRSSQGIKFAWQVACE